MKLEEIKGKDSRELLLDMEALRKELFGLRFKSASEEVANTSRFRQIKKTIARIKTILRQREIAAAANEAATAEAANNG